MMKRRTWLAHCSGLLAAPGALGALPKRRHVLVVGDSLSAEYGIARGSGWVALLEAKLQQGRSPTTVFNASVSGDTTAGGVSRLPPLLQQQKPSHVLIELGGNDALRGLPLEHTRRNLQAMVRASRAAGAQPVLIGMQVPANYGSRYTQGFANLFGELAKEEKAALVPFLLAGVADRPDADAWFQADRIHPLARAHPVMLDNVWAVLQRLL